ncbi:MAG: nuclear transport factor 2 family protein [Halioglobus sp.]
MAILLLAGMPVRADSIDAIGRSLDAFHDAAARADFAAYSGLMTREVVFLGTDATERWQGDSFRTFAKPYFDEGRGWTYLPQERHIDLMPNEKTAFFDELLSHERLGTCRGSGVMILDGGQWKVAQYNLSVPIPNDLVDGVAQQIVASEREMSGLSNEAGSTNDSAVDGETASESPPTTSNKCQRKRHKTNSKAGC